MNVEVQNVKHMNEKNGKKKKINPQTKQGKRDSFNCAGIL